MGSSRLNAPFRKGWHVDVSFGLENPDFMEWRANINSRGRARLMLFLFSDVGELDAPTRIGVGSHHDVVRRLASAGEAGFSLRNLAATGFQESAQHLEALTTGFDWQLNRGRGIASAYPSGE